MLTLICGLPNAGKTTYSQRFGNVVHTDEVEPVGRSYTKGVLKAMEESEGDVCVEGTYITRHSRKQVLEAYQGDGKTCVWLDTPLETCIEREDRNRSTVLVRNCAMLFEPPTYDEGWDEIWIVRNDERIRLER